MVIWGKQKKNWKSLACFFLEDSLLHGKWLFVISRQSEVAEVLRMKILNFCDHLPKVMPLVQMT